MHVVKCVGRKISWLENPYGIWVQNHPKYFSLFVLHLLWTCLLCWSVPRWLPPIRKKLGDWCGPAENWGEALISWVLNHDTNKLITRSVLCSTVPTDNDSKNKPVNFRTYFDTDLDFPAGLEGSQVNPSVKNEISLHSLNEELSKLNDQEVGFNTDPANLLGFSFACDTKENTQRCVVKNVDEEN